MDYTNSLENLEKIKQVVAIFQNLKVTTEELHKKVCNAGWAQRNALISHVYSNYNEHENLINHKSEWENLVLEHNVHQKLLDYLSSYRDLYGYFP